MEIKKYKPIRLKGVKLKILLAFVLERDDSTCQDRSCPGGFPLDPPHHIIFKSQGGEDTPENLITLCRYCHGQRHGVNYVI